jgi:hypothetical protein
MQKNRHVVASRFGVRIYGTATVSSPERLFPYGKRKKRTKEKARMSRA